MSESFKKMMASAEYERVFESEKWLKEIPFLDFKLDLLVKILPPLTGAIIRFWVCKKDNPKKIISIYLDCYDVLGGVGHPYWEIYPNCDGDNERYGMHETGLLIDGIEKALGKVNAES